MPVRPRLDLAILGGNGLDRSGYITEDFLSKLHGLAGVKVYREMSENDPVIGALLYAITTLLRNVEWHVDPADESGTPGDEAADFVKESLFDDMSHTFADFIEETLTCLPYGFAITEIVWKRRGGMDTSDPTKYSKFDDGRIGIRKLAGRSQDTLDHWDLQLDGGINGVWQSLPDGRGIVYIPIQKSLLFRVGIRKGNPEGRSVLRTAYVPWMRKTAIEIAEGRGAMRSAGIVNMGIPSEIMLSTDPTMMQIYNSYKVIADRLAQDRQGSVILPSDMDEHGNRMYTMEYTATDGQRPADMSAIVERYDKRIAATVLADFILLGQQSVGSFALSQDKTQIFEQSLAAYLTMIAEVLNRFLLPRLWRLNNFDQALMPKLKPNAISRQALDELGNYIQKLAGAGMPLFPDEDLEQKLRDLAKLPQASPETLKLREVQQQKDDVLAHASAGLGPDGKPLPVPAVAGARGKLKVVKDRFARLSKAWLEPKD